MLSPEQYEIVDVRTSLPIRRAMLFPKALLQAEFEDRSAFKHMGM
jgi:hypothetical protein